MVTYYDLITRFIEFFLLTFLFTRFYLMKISMSKSYRMDDIQRYFSLAQYIVRLSIINVRFHFELKFKKIMKIGFLFNSTISLILILSDKLKATANII